MKAWSTIKKVELQWPKTEAQPRVWDTLGQGRAGLNKGRGVLGGGYG